MIKDAIPSEWRLSIMRDGGWSGSAEKTTATHKVKINAYSPKYPSFEDVYNVLREKIKIYESEKLK